MVAYAHLTAGLDTATRGGLVTLTVRADTLLQVAVLKADLLTSAAIFADCWGVVCRCGEGFVNTAVTAILCQWLRAEEVMPEVKPRACRLVSVGQAAMGSFLDIKEA